jgi:hypothetical protein
VPGVLNRSFTIIVDRGDLNFEAFMRGCHGHDLHTRSLTGFDSGGGISVPSLQDCFSR